MAAGFVKQSCVFERSSECFAASGWVEGKERIESRGDRTVWTEEETRQGMRRIRLVGAGWRPGVGGAGAAPEQELLELLALGAAGCLLCRVPAHWLGVPALALRVHKP